MNPLTNKAWWSKYSARCNIIMKYYTIIIFVPVVIYVDIERISSSIFCSPIHSSKTSTATRIKSLIWWSDQRRGNQTVHDKSSLIIILIYILCHNCQALSILSEYVWWLSKWIAGPMKILENMDQFVIFFGIQFLNVG